MRSLLLILGVALCASAVQAEVPQELNTIQLSDGVSINMPSGEMKHKQVGDTTHVRIRGQNLVYSLVAKQGSSKSCKQQVLNASVDMKKARAKDPENFEKLMVLRSEKSCDLHETCLVQEFGQRNPDEYKNGTPFREAISYAVCLDDRFFILMGFLLPSGTPVADADRAVMQQVVRSLKKTKKPPVRGSK